MNTRNISITVTGRAADTGDLDRFVRLEQVEVPESSGRANLYDLYQMLQMARSGLSAWSYLKDNCPMTVKDGVVTVALDFLAWPSSLDLDYSVRVAPGTVGPPTLVRQEREIDLVIDNTDRVVLPWIASDISVTWLSPALVAGSPVARPEVTVDGSVISLSRSCFGVIRVSCTAIGHLYTALLSLRKGDEDTDEEVYRLTNLESTAWAAWSDNGEAMETSIDLEIPSCVEQYLALCPGEGGLKTDIRGPDGKSRQLVYYSSCTGRIIEVGTL